MASTCPVCGQPATGRFCSNCGTNLESAPTCTECGNELPAGARFCNRCGAPTLAARAAMSEQPTSGSDSRAQWIVAATGVVAVLVVLAVWFFGREDAATAPAIATAPPTAPAGGPGAIDLSAMTPREAADRLFQRVMILAEGGDSAQARAFLPMALAAYEQVPREEIDADARYHLGLLHLVADEPARTRAQADTILATDPNHLFGLYHAARAEADMGDDETARAYFQRFLEAYEPEMARDRPEYQEHARALPLMRQEASRAVDSP